MQYRTADSLETQGEYNNEKYTISIRNGFVRKVLGIVSTQLLCSTIFAGLLMYVPSITPYFDNPAVILLSFVCTIGTMLPLLCGMSKKFPINMILLACFTVFESIMVGVICLSYSKQYGDSIVFQAFAVTATVTAAIAIYACQSKRDFADYFGVAMIFGVSILFASILNWFLRSSVMSLVISVAMAALYGFYLLHDLQALLKKNVDVDDYVLMAMRLYVDIIGLFLEILRILGFINSNEQR